MRSPNRRSTNTDLVGFIVNDIYTQKVDHNIQAQLHKKCYLFLAKTKIKTRFLKRIQPFGNMPFLWVTPYLWVRFAVHDWLYAYIHIQKFGNRYRRTSTHFNLKLFLDREKSEKHYDIYFMAYALKGTELINTFGCGHYASCFTS